MKKFLLGVSSLALAGVFAFSGCSCSKTGTYKFEKLELIVGDETFSYSCTTENKNSLPGVKTACEMTEKDSYELTKDEFIYYLDGEEFARGKYKIEDKKLYYRLEDDDEWEEYADYEKNAIVVSIDSDDDGKADIKAYYKK